MTLGNEMNKIKINPAPGQGLDFDLRDLLQLLGPRAVLSQWMLSGLNYLSQDDRPIPALDGPKGKWISGSDLVSSLSNLMQVVDGVFAGHYSSTSEKPWIILRAVDSSWWEAETDDQNATTQIRERFENIEDQKGIPNTAPGTYFRKSNTTL